MRTICLLSLCFALLASSWARSDDETGYRIIRSWPALEQRLTEESGSSADQMLGSSVFDQIVDHGNVALFREMTGQECYQHVRLAGFLALQQHSETAAVEAGLQIWLNLASCEERKDDAWEIMHEPLRVFLTHADRVPLVLERLESFSQTNPVRLAPWSALIIALPADELYEWFHGLEEGALYLSYEGYLAEWLATRATEHRPVTDRMRRAMEHRRRNAGQSGNSNNGK